MGQPRIIVGANVICYMNGKPFGLVEEFSFSAATPSRVIGGIDQPEVLELAPTTSTCTWIMKLWRTKASGGIQGVGMTPVSTEVARGKYFNFILLDRVTDTILFQGSFCRVDNESWTTAAKRMMSGVVNGKSMTWSNEVRPLKR